MPHKCFDLVELEYTYCNPGLRMGRPGTRPTLTGLVYTLQLDLLDTMLVSTIETK